MKKNLSSSSSGFTLLELLIVVSILAVLATVVVIVINPAQILPRARDSNRLSELASLNKALQIAQVQGISSFGSPNTVYVSIPDSSPACSNLGLPPLPSGWSYACVSSSTYKDADSTGWIPVNFSLLPSGSPLSSLPVDSVNSTSSELYYTYTTDSSNWEFTAMLESSDRHDQAINDGDAFPGVYSLGTSKGLTPATRDMGLVGYWKMDETSWTNDCSSATVIDSSGNGNNGKSCPASTGPTGGAVGQVGKAGSFDGANNYLQYGDVLDMRTNNMSISAWIKDNATSATDYYIVSKSKAGSQNYRYGVNIQASSGYPKIFMQGNGGADVVPVGNINVADGKWHFLAFIFDRGANASIYIDGAYNAGASISSWKGVDMNSNNPFRIGSYTNADNISRLYLFNGTIDDTRIYNRVLSAAEIQAIYNATK